MRPVLAHIHLFKNAGTSVEQGLHRSFRKRWISWDKERPNARISGSELLAHLRERPEVEAVSSHQLRPPLVSDDEISVVGLVFLRHPLDRIRSAYEFERTQGADSPSARAAAAMPIIEWIDFHDERGSAQCANFQTVALTSLRASNGAPDSSKTGSEHLRSAKTLLESLPVVGLVEHYAASCEQMNHAYGKRFPALDLAPTHANRTRGGNGVLEDRLRELRKKLGSKRYASLERDNERDIELWRWAQIPYRG